VRQARAAERGMERARETGEVMAAYTLLPLDDTIVLKKSRLLQ
jgi:hypothetical protein